MAEAAQTDNGRSRVSLWPKTGLGVAALKPEGQKIVDAIDEK
jgi:hypothetical protein